MLNLPEEVTFTNGNSTKFFYSAEGEKLRAVHTTGGTTTQVDYCGNIVYEEGYQKYLLNQEGYYDLAAGGYHYYLKDHLGNNRVVISHSGAVEQTTHYYPYGGTFASTTNGSNTQPYKYNGKELDTHNGLNWYDYGARHYDPTIARWTTQDPLAEKYYGWNPYNFCGANPVLRVDSDGKIWETVWDVISIAAGVKNLTENISQGNYDAALEDGAGILVDVVAALIPLVPGGVSAVRTAARAVDKVDEFADAKKVGNSTKSVVGKHIQPNGGKAKPHGKSDHNEAIDSVITELKTDENNKNIRKNQKQVDSQGNTVGNNRPDVQWDNDGIHHNLEVDRTTNNNKHHEQVVKKNDPNSIFHGKIL